MNQMMDSSENNQQGSVNPFDPNSSIMIKYRQSSRRSSVFIGLEIPVSPLEEADYHRKTHTTPIVVKYMSMQTIGQQLNRRKILQNRLTMLSDLMCFLGLLGVVLMLISNEIMFRSNDGLKICWFIQLLITISSVVLMSLVLIYHYSNMQLYAIENSLDNYRVGLTLKRIFLILFELFICSIHPIPRSFPWNWFSKDSNIPIHANTTDFSPVSSNIDPSYIAMDVALGLPMFARLYLISRCLMFHSSLIRDAPFKSFGSFNQVSMNFFFVIKTYLLQWPGRCLTLSCFVMFFIGSWSIHACDYKPINDKQISLFDSMWLFIITFTTVGYGDLTPSTYCGRTIVSVIALFGLLSSALLISVVAEKFQLTRWEKHVYNFAFQMQLRRQRREQASNIIKSVLKLYFLQHHQRPYRTFEYFRFQRLLHQSIASQRMIKQEQRKLRENSLDFLQSIDLQRYTTIKTKRIAKDLLVIQSTIEQQFVDLNQTMKTIQITIDQLMKNKS